MTKKDQSALMFILILPLTSILIFNLKISSDRISFLQFISYTYPIYITLFYFIRIKKLFKKSIFIVGVALWTILTALLFKDTFIAISLGVMSIIIMIGFITFITIKEKSTV